MQSAYIAMIYILIQLKVKFGFSVTPVNGGLNRILLMLRRRTSFVISVLGKCHDNRTVFCFLFP